MMGSQCSTPQSSPWYASFFLDPGIRWCRMKTGDAIYLHAVPWLTIAMLLFRSLIERWLIIPFGLYCNVTDKSCSPPEKNSVLSKAYADCRNPQEEMLHNLAQAVGWSPYRVHKWFWRARQYGKPSQLTKFKNSSWKFLIYSCTLITGLFILSKEDFFWDHERCYANYPANTPPDMVLRYWVFQLAFYISLLVSHQHTNSRRNDYTLIFCHHLLTVVLLGIAFVSNGVQIGALMLLNHDIADVPLELSKLLLYINFLRLARLIFAVFGILFFVTRLIIYPFFLMWNAVFAFPAVMSHSPAWWLAITLLVILQGMHIYWFYLIANMMVPLMRGYDEEVGIRSDSELFVHEDQSVSGSDAYSKRSHY